MISLRTWTALACLLAALPSPAQAHDYPIQAVPPSSVKVQDTFWAPRLETNRRVTIPHNLRELEAQGSLGGFALLAGRTGEKYHGYMFGDSDVYKTLEGIVYSLRDHPDRALAARLEQLIGAIAAAQAADGYLMPHIQLTEPAYRHFSDETTRTCESYCMGHLIESAVAHYEATGRKTYLDVAVKLADLLVRVHGGGKDEQISGHPEIELALVRLYRATGERKYLELARSYVQNARSHSAPAWSGGTPYLADKTARGHAVASTAFSIPTRWPARPARSINESPGSAAPAVRRTSYGSCRKSPATCMPFGVTTCSSTCLRAAKAGSTSPVKR